VATNPITSAPDTLSVFLPDQAVMNVLHMVTSVPDRTPTFTMFGNPNYFNQVATASQGHATTCPTASACVFESPAFAWNHGDVQSDITTTWFGMAGPGVSSIGRNDSVFSDHTDLRPTVLALLGLTDDYVSDGRVLMEFVAPELVPDRHQYVNLAQVYKQINAPLGKLGLATLTYANRSIMSISSNDAAYNDYLNKIGGIASTRNNLQPDLKLLTEGAIGSANVGANGADLRFKNYNVSGPYPLVDYNGHSLYDTYGGSPVHRFYQMWQQLDCDAKVAAAKPTSNPSGCQNDLFPWVEQTASSGGNGGTPPQHEGNIAMGFYNVANGDMPYFAQLANQFTINDNYHQPVMGGTYANMMMFGYADALYYADGSGNPATPDHVLALGSNPPKYFNEIENPNPQSGTNNWYTNDGYSGGSYTNCSDKTQSGVPAIVNYLAALPRPVNPNCAPNAFYLLNNYVPSYIGSGATDPVNNGPFTLPPVRNQRHIGDLLTQRKCPGRISANAGTTSKPLRALVLILARWTRSHTYTATSAIRSSTQAQ
jgi:hypothetical protein